MIGSRDSGEEFEDARVYTPRPCHELLQEGIGGDRKLEIGDHPCRELGCLNLAGLVQDNGRGSQPQRMEDLVGRFDSQELCQRGHAVQRDKDATDVEENSGDRGSHEVRRLVEPARQR